jgi:FkbM family methyltransferase
MRSELGLPVNVCIFDDKRFFYTPDSLNVHDLWVHQCTSYYTRGEVREWLRFSEGCRSLLDAGASAGFFSAVFNRTTEGAGSILSVEPDKRSFALLQETIRLNNGINNWRSANCALSGTVGELEFSPSDFGGGLGSAGNSRQNIYRGPGAAAASALAELVRVETLDSLCESHQFVPDLIKMDIESYEFETLTAAKGFLSKLRPKIFLELHNEMIRARGLRPETIVEALHDVGYRCMGGSNPAALCAPPTAHLCIVPS